MPFSLFQRIRRHAAIAGGKFEVLFREINMVPLEPAAVRLIEELNKPEAGMEEIAGLIGSMPEISTRILKTVNSSLFALRSPVLSIRHAVSLLGLDHVRAVALSYVTVNSVPRPAEEIFNHKAFWGDSLVRALVARGLASHYCPQYLDDAFTAMLIADVALPVLLTKWTEYYRPVVQEWMEGDRRLSQIENSHFGWNHAQAGAWILQTWNFPEQLVCFVGIHNSDPQLIDELQLEGTIALPLMVASLLPASLHQQEGRTGNFLHRVHATMGIAPAELERILFAAEQGFLDICSLMGLDRPETIPALESVRMAMTQTDAVQ